jgi:glutamate racemase
MSGDLHLVITDSGLGGLSICAEIERNLRTSGAQSGARLTYVNAWPEEGSGYNVLPDQASRAQAFDRALAAMEALRPDRILIACNTLSIVYPMTVHAWTSATPVLGIVDAGVELFYEALRDSPASALVVLGTKTTVESGVHREKLAARGIDPRRIGAIACHGLAAAVESNPAGTAAAHLVERYASEVRSLGLPGETLLAGLACTHFEYVADAMSSAIERHAGKAVRALNPNYRFVDLVAPESKNRPDPSTVVVEVISKVLLKDEARRGIGNLIEHVSPATARALQSYVHAPDLF